MVYSPTIYDWRQNCAPINQEFRAGGMSIAGGLTLGGAMVENPEPGGRAELFMSFATFVTPEANRDASWTISRITNGSIMRVKLWNSVQLIPGEDLDGPFDEGLPWSNGGPWANGQNWAWNPITPVSASAAKGATSVTLDLSVYGQVLQIGHVFGFLSGGYHFTHVAMDVSYDESDVATVTISPPLRRAVTSSDFALFRPSMLVQCRNARDVMGEFTSGRHMQFNRANFMEALV